MSEVEKVLVSDETTATKLNINTPSVPSVEFQYVQPFLLVLVRTVRTYLQSLLGIFMAAGFASQVIPFTDLKDLLIKSLGLALAPAIVSLVQNLIELLASVDKTNPVIRG